VQLGQEPGLADPRLAAHDQQPSLAAGDRIQHARDRLELRRASVQAVP
jgi:hypothetical protein